MPAPETFLNTKIQEESTGVADQLIKHDRYIEALCGQINPHYDVLLRNIPLYSKRKRLVGEIDVLAIKDDYCDIYEVKCSYRVVKAKRQLLKIRKLLKSQKKVRNSCFFCGESGKIEVIKN